ncbi:MAG: glycosyltransferase family 39 protein, partial [Anaerolineae bacterium]|nr:glycosyltransferase family 39 protein [Anaerolineae bacterium]
MKALRWLAIALLCVAWLLLLFRLDSTPPGFQHDQTFASLNALRVVGGDFPLYFPANFGVAPGFMYAAAAVFRVTDGHYVWALRFTSAMLAMVGLAVSLSFARRYLSPAPALFAAALMAGSYWFLFAGRLGLEAISLLPLALACFYVLHRAQERPRLSLYLLAGVLGGAAIYTYTASRTLFALPAQAAHKRAARNARRHADCQRPAANLHRDPPQRGGPALPGAGRPARSARCRRPCPAGCQHRRDGSRS